MRNILIVDLNPILLYTSIEAILFSSTDNELISSNSIFSKTRIPCELVTTYLVYIFPVISLFLEAYNDYLHYERISFRRPIHTRSMIS